MKSLNHDTCHLSRHNSNDKKMADDKDANAFMLLYFLTAKQRKKRTLWVRRWLLDGYVICWSYISSADCLWKLNHAPKVGQLYRLSDVGFKRLITQSTRPVTLGQPQYASFPQSVSWYASNREERLKHAFLNTLQASSQTFPNGLQLCHGPRSLFH